MFIPAALIVFSELNFASSFVFPSEGLYHLDIIHFNDFHARFEETTTVSPTCRFNNGSCLGGFPRLYRAIQDLKRQKPEAILLNAGDSFQGTYWYTLLKRNITQEFMNLLPHDAHTIGNHDFDDGPQGLAPYLKALKAPVLAANMDSSKEPLLQNLYKPYIVLQRSGRKIGIIGLITTDTKTLSFTGKIEFTDPNEATKRVAQELIELGVDIIILLSHCGYDVDVSLAREHGQYVDVIVGGHSHRDESVFKPYLTVIRPDADKTKQSLLYHLLRFRESKNHKKKEDLGLAHEVMYMIPTLLLQSYLRVNPSNLPITSETTWILRLKDELMLNLNFEIIGFRAFESDTVVVQASAFTKVLGSLSVYFDVNGNVAKWKEAPIALDKSIPEDKEIKEKLAPYAKLVHEAENTPVGEIRSSLDYHDCAHGECKLGNLLTDALNHWTRQITKSKYGCISFIQRSNIKAILAQGPITKGMLIDLFPYYDFVETFELKGRCILKMLERSMTKLATLHPVDGPWILQFSGLRVRYNVSEPEGRRVMYVHVGDHVAGKELDKDGIYQVTAPAYLADGGDGYSVFKHEKKHINILGRDQILLKKYIKKFSPITVTIDGRLSIAY